MDFAYKLPQLKDVFLATPPNVNINIDLKDASPVLLDEVHKSIVECKRESSVIWGSVATSFGTTFAKKDPTIARFLSPKEVAKMVLQYYTFLLPFCSIPATHFEVGYITTPFRDTIRSTGRGNKWLRGFCGRCLLSCLLRFYQYTMTSKTFIRHLQARGVKVVFWVLQTEDDFEKACALGVDGIMTDYPTRLVEFLKRRKARQGF